MMVRSLVGDDSLAVVKDISIFVIEGVVAPLVRHVPTGVHRADLVNLQEDAGSRLHHTREHINNAYGEQRKWN